MVSVLIISGCNSPWRILTGLLPSTVPTHQLVAVIDNITIFVHLKLAITGYSASGRLGDENHCRNSQIQLIVGDGDVLPDSLLGHCSAWSQCRSGSAATPWSLAAEA